MKLDVKYVRAVKELQSDRRFLSFVEWIGEEAGLANERLIFSRDEDVHELRGRCQALAQVLKAIDTAFKQK